jgi:cbb3-type cytochrome oxidase subunit 3
VALTRISATWFIGVFIVLCIYHLYTTYNNKIVDNILSNSLIEYNKKESIYISTNRDRFIQFGLIVGLIIIGVLFYEKHKKQKHDKEFKLIKFIFNK